MLAVLCINARSQAAVGDTTWVGANNTQMPWFGSYDSTVVFPAQGKSYRAIYMIFTLGKYLCPGSPTYCGDWDYTVLNYLITPGGQSYELGRFITPYANANAPRTPWTWQQRYVYDVTDFAPLLHDTAKIRIFYSGYSGDLDLFLDLGELIDAVRELPAPVVPLLVGDVLPAGRAAAARTRWRPRRGCSPWASGLSSGFFFGSAGLVSSRPITLAAFSASGVPAAGVAGVVPAAAAGSAGLLASGVDATAAGFAVGVAGFFGP